MTGVNKRSCDPSGKTIAAGEYIDDQMEANADGESEFGKALAIADTLAKTLQQEGIHVHSHKAAADALANSLQSLTSEQEHAFVTNHFETVLSRLLQQLHPHVLSLRAAGSSTAECADAVAQSSPGNTDLLAAVAAGRHRGTEHLQASVEQRAHLAVSAVEQGKAEVSVVDALIDLAKEREVFLRHVLCAQLRGKQRAEVLAKCAALTPVELAKFDAVEEGLHAFLQRVQAAREAAAEFRRVEEHERANALESKACSSPAPLKAARLLARNQGSYDRLELADVYVRQLSEAEFQEAKGTYRQQEEPPEEPSKASDEDLFFVG